MSDKWEQLLQKLQGYGSAAVAFSGGSDSALVLKAAMDALGDRCAAFTIEAPIFPQRELRWAVDAALGLGAAHHRLPVNIFDVPALGENPPERCYHCKKHIFANLKRAAGEMGFSFVLDGTNADDSKDFRPGVKALQELEVISPLRDLGITKEEVYMFLDRAGLAQYKRPSNACLASRFPFGEPISIEKLKMVEAAEEVLNSLGFPHCRVRCHGTIARVELPSPQIEEAALEDVRKPLVAGLMKLGFSFVSLDLSGYTSGSLNRLITGGERHG